MIRIKILTLEDSWEYLDLFDSESVIINEKLSDSSDIAKIFLTYSNIFKIPASDLNRSLLGGAFDKTIDTDNDEFKCVIELNDGLFKEGVVSNAEMQTTFGQGDYININFSSALSSLKEKLGDLTLNDLDLGGLYVFDGFRDVEVSTWDHTTVPKLITQGVVPIASTKRRFTANKTDVYYPDNILGDASISGAVPKTSQINLNELRPSVSIMEILYKIIDTLGYSAFVDFSVAQKELLSKTKLLCTSSVYHNTGSIAKGWIFDGEPEIAPFGSITPKWFLRVDTADSQYLNLYCTDPTTLQKPSIHYRVTIDPVFDGMDDPAATIDIYRQTPAGEVLLKSGSATVGFDNALTAALPLDTGIIGFPSISDPIKFRINRRFNTLPKLKTNLETPYYENLSLVASDGTLFGYYSHNILGVLSYENIKPYKMLPNMKQVDFIQSMIKMFNLSIVNNNKIKYSNLSSTKPGKENLLFRIAGAKIQFPLTTENYVDITAYIDGDSFKVIKQPKYGNYKFSHTLSKGDQSKNWVSANVNNPSSKEYGQLIYNASNKESKYEVLTKFVVPPMEIIAGTNVPTFSLIDDNKKFLANEPILFVTSTYPYIFRNIQDSTVQFNLEYGYLSKNTTLYAARTTTIFDRGDSTDTGVASKPSITFKDEVSLINNVVITNNLFSEFYSNTVNRIADKRVYGYKIKGRMPIAFVQSYDITTPVKINGEFYKIQDSQIDITTGRFTMTINNITTNSL